jgi:transcriptional antiterminator RfaH
LPWIVARTKPNHERIAKEHAERQQHVCYLPFYYDSNKSGNQTKRVLFPCYLFVEIELQFYHLKYTRGITNIIMMDGEQPSYVPDESIYELKRREKNGCVELDAQQSKFLPDDPVIVTYGPFADRLGLYRGQSTQDRVRVLMDMLGGKREVLVPARALEAA